MDFHELVLAGDLWSIGIRNRVVNRRMRPEVSLSTDVADISLISSNIRLYHAVAIASAQKNKESLEAESIVRAASIRVRFCLSTMPFCSGVRGVDVLCSIHSSLKYAWSVLFKNSVPLSVRTEIT
ncbi:hypothetical protein Tco_1140111 [Tanacetum coccineum]